MVGVTNGAPASTNRSQRILAYLIAVLVIISLASFVAVIAGTAMGAGGEDGFSSGAWPAVIMLPWFALPLAMLLTITLLVTSAISRSKDQPPSR